MLIPVIDHFKHTILVEPQEDCYDLIERTIANNQRLLGKNKYKLHHFLNRNGEFQYSIMFK